ncbi:DUF4276 family protein [Thiocapsa sp.]|uniref:DUF4276 family protein n=1 Tax=Thiocapsa sp. TaxID=2024551 RepID=UPI003592FE0F
MRKFRIVPIVEGYGEERAVPLLMRRWLRHRNLHRWFDIPDLAVNAKGSGRLKAPFDPERHRGIEHYIATALTGRPDAILVLLDADDECQTRAKNEGLGPTLLARARAVAREVPLAVVIANREYEAWFLANLTALRARGLLPLGRLPEPLQPEVRRDCKGLIERLLGCSYEERFHQLKLTEAMTFSPRAAFRSPSYGKLLRDLERLTREARHRRAA